MGRGGGELCGPHRFHDCVRSLVVIIRRQSINTIHNRKANQIMTTIKIEFEHGGVFEARLLEDEAPKTCATIKQRLPFEYRFQQSIVSGQAILALPPDLTVEPENQRVAGILPGSLSFLVQDKTVLVPDEIYIAYGIFISRGLTIDMKQPVNVFAQIETNLEELQHVGRRIHLEGAEMARFTLGDSD
jgi:hypothetical protein